MQVTASKWALEGVGCSIAEVGKLRALKPLLSYLLKDLLAKKVIKPSAIQRSIAYDERIGFISAGTGRCAA